MCGRSSAAMPGPRSSTVNPTAAARRHEPTVIGVPAGLYFAALSSRLSSNWAASAGWTEIDAGGSKCNCAIRVARAARRASGPVRQSASGRARPVSHSSGIRSESPRARNNSDSTICRIRTAGPMYLVEHLGIVGRPNARAGGRPRSSSAFRPKACATDARRRRQNAAAARPLPASGRTDR